MQNPNKLNKVSTKGIISYSGDEINKIIATQIKTMKKNWDFLRSFNVVEKGYQRPVDIKAVYNLNKDLEKRIIELKIASICLNFGLKSTDELPKASSYPTIFVRSQLKSRLDNLQTLSLKYDKSKEDIVLDFEFVKNEKIRLQQEILKCENELSTFNNKFVITV